MAKKYEESSGSHPSQDKSGRFSIDSLIRSYGFEIHSRKSGSLPLWKKDGKLFTQKEALSSIPKNEVRQAILEEKIHLEKL